MASAEQWRLNMQRMVDPSGAVSDDRIRQVHIRMLLGEWERRFVRGDNTTLGREALAASEYLLDNLPVWCSEGLLDGLLLGEKYLAGPEGEEASMANVLNRLNELARGHAHSARFGDGGERLTALLQMLLDYVKAHHFPEPVPTLVSEPVWERIQEGEPG